MPLLCLLWSVAGGRQTWYTSRVLHQILQFLYWQSWKYNRNIDKKSIKIRVRISDRMPKGEFLKHPYLDMDIVHKISVYENSVKEFK